MPWCMWIYWPASAYVHAVLSIWNSPTLDLSRISLLITPEYGEPALMLSWTLLQLGRIGPKKGTNRDKFLRVWMLVSSSCLLWIFTSDTFQWWKITSMSSSLYLFMHLLYESRVYRQRPLVLPTIFCSISLSIIILPFLKRTRGLNLPVRQRNSFTTWGCVG